MMPEENNEDTEDSEKEVVETDKNKRPATSSIGNINKKTRVTKNPNKSAKLRSWVWQYCNRIKREKNEILVECIVEVSEGCLCNWSVITDGSTSNVISHLRNTHRITEKSAESKQAQPNVDSVVAQSPQRKPAKQEKLDQYLIEFMIEDQQPLNLLRSEGFRKFVERLNPIYELPSEKAVKTKIYDAYDSCVEILRERLSTEAFSCSLTTDLLTTRSNQSYIGITCSFIDSNFHIQEFVLGIRKVPYPHTANAIQQTLEKICEEWKILNKTFTLTTDNAPNMIKVGKKWTNVTRISCTDHTLQLVVGKGLQPAEALIARAKRLINFLTSQKQMERLTSVQKTLPRNDHVDIEKINECFSKAVNDMDDTWNSTFLAWERLLEIKDHINVLVEMLSKEPESSIKGDGQTLERMMLTSQEWNLMAELMDILDPLAEAAEFLRGSSYATMSVIYPIIFKLVNDLDLTPSNLSEVDDDADDLINMQTPFDDDVGNDLGDIDFEEFPQSRHISVENPTKTEGLLDKIKLELYEGFSYYWRVPEELGLLATLLDPRGKNLNFATKMQVRRVRELLKQQYDSLKQEKEINTVETTVSSSQPTSIVQSSKFRRPFIQNVFVRPEVATNVDNQETELKRYYEMPQIPFESNPFEWWRVQQQNFPVLYVIARKYLAIAAMSTASKRLFADARIAVFDKHIQSDPNVIDKLLFLKHNMSHFGGIFSKK